MNALKRIKVKRTPLGEKADIEIVESGNQSMLSRPPQADTRICLTHLEEEMPDFEIKKS